MTLNTITRRERWIAKICWPEINTQRTRFLLLNTEDGFFYLPDYGDVETIYYTADERVPVRQVAIERIQVSNWQAIGKRRRVVARWGYSRRLDTVVIRDVILY